MVSHPIQHFAPWYKEAAKLPSLDLKVFFYANWGLAGDVDPGFGTNLKWDIPLLEGYAHKFLPMQPTSGAVNDPELDNPSVAEALSDFAPDVIMVFGYSHRTTRRVAAWTTRNAKPLLLFTDSSYNAQPIWKLQLKKFTVGRFYKTVDGALTVGDSNREYHRHFGISDDRLFPGCLPVDRQRLLDSIGDKAAARRTIREQYGIPDDAFVTLFCGKFTQGKRPLDLVRAVTGNDRSTWALMVGDGKLRPDIEQHLEQTSANNVVLAGLVNQSTIASYYTAADVLVVSSSADAHPLVVTEAASFGLPIIISDAVGCIGANDTADPNLNAIVYDCGNVEALATTIALLKNNRDAWHRFSRGSLETASRQDTQTAAAQLESAVTKLKKLGKRSKK